MELGVAMVASPVASAETAPLVASMVALAAELRAEAQMVMAVGLVVSVASMALDFVVAVFLEAAKAGPVVEVEEALVVEAEVVAIQAALLEASLVVTAGPEVVLKVEVVVPTAAMRGMAKTVQVLKEVEVVGADSSGA